MYMCYMYNYGRYLSFWKIWVSVSVNKRRNWENHRSEEKPSSMNVFGGLSDPLVFKSFFKSLTKAASEGIDLAQK